MTCLRYTPTDDNRCWTVEALGEEIARIRQLTPGLCTIVPARALFEEEMRSIEAFVWLQRREQQRAKRKANGLEWLESIYRLEDTRAA